MIQRSLPFLLMVITYFFVSSQLVIYSTSFQKGDKEPPLPTYNNKDTIPLNDTTIVEETAMTIPISGVSNTTTTVKASRHSTSPFVINKESGVKNGSIGETREPTTTITNTYTPSLYRIRESSTTPKFKLYLHPKGDLVSDSFFNRGYWQDCIDHGMMINKYFRQEKPEHLVVVDVGANIGTCSLLYLSRGYNVYAFEPMTRNFQLFNQSIHANQHLKSRIVAVNAGVTFNVSNTSDSDDVTSTRKIYSEVGNMGNSIVSQNLSKEDKNRLASSRANGIVYLESMIHLTTLDNVIKEHVHYMKLDCQGCELSALLGARELLSKYKVDVIRFEFTYSFLKAQNQDPLDLLLLLEAHKYAIYRHNGQLLPSSLESFRSFIRHFELIAESQEDLIAVRIT